jgi:hypothetical protein
MVGMNTQGLVRQCLVSLHEAGWSGLTHEIIYVDNASRDGSVAAVRREFPDVKVIANERNMHFCPAANQASHLASGEFLLHLNNDTVVAPDAIRLMVEFLREHPQAAAAGCRLLNPDGSDQWSARRFPAWYNAFFGRRSLLSRLWPDFPVVRRYLFKDELASGKPFAVDWTGTVCMLVRRDDFFSVGAFPEDYYYWHESVFCHRLALRGRQTWMVPAAEVTHFEGMGGGPRSYAVRCWHITDFSSGAYRFQVERHRLGPWHPSRWFTRALLAARAGVLLTANWLRSQASRRSAA